MGLALDLRRLGDGVHRLTTAVSPEELGLVWPGLTFESEVRVALEVARAGDDLDLVARFEGERRAECNRCLKPFRETYSGSLRAIGRRALPGHELAGQDGVVFHDGHQLELTAEVREGILLEIPIQQLCSPGCLGLCPTCGVDRNMEPCSCRVERLDPRWEQLRKARGG